MIAASVLCAAEVEEDPHSIRSPVLRLCSVGLRPYSGVECMGYDR